MLLFVWWVLTLLAALFFVALLSASRSTALCPSRSATGPAPSTGMLLSPVLVWFFGSLSLVRGGDLTFAEVLPPSLAASLVTLVSAGVLYLGERVYLGWAAAEGFSVVRPSYWSSLCFAWTLLRLPADRREVLSVLLADDCHGSLFPDEARRALRVAALL